MKDTSMIRRTFLKASVLPFVASLPRRSRVKPGDYVFDINSKCFKVLGASGEWFNIPLLIALHVDTSTLKHGRLLTTKEAIKAGAFYKPLPILSEETAAKLEKLKPGCTNL